MSFMFCFAIRENGRVPLFMEIRRTSGGLTGRFRSMLQKATTQNRCVEARPHTNCNLAVPTLK
jgi:hypothetical protein